MKNNRNIVFFDGFCNLCNGWVRFITKWDRKQVFQFASLSAKRTEASQTILYYRKSKMHNKSTAVLYMLWDLGGLWKITCIFFAVPPFVRNAVYDFVAKNRYKWAGKRTTCMVPSPELQKRFLTKPEIDYFAALKRL